MMPLVCGSQSMASTISSSSVASAAASGTRLSLTVSDQIRPAVAIARDIGSPACVVRSRNSR